MVLARIAKAMATEGHKTVACLHSLTGGSIAFKDSGKGPAIPVLQAPVWPKYRHNGVLTGAGNYVNILTSIGFHRPAALQAMVDGWLSILSLIKPAVAIVDHSPAFQIAARIRNLPVIAIGTPYLMPPLDGRTLPSVNAHISPLADELRHLESAQEVLAQYRHAAPLNLPDLLATQSRFVMGLPEIDPYLSVRREQLYLPFEPLPDHVPVPRNPSFFVYLGGDEPNGDVIFQAISDLAVEASFYLRGENPMIARFLERRGHVVYRDPPRLADVLPRATHLISGGGAQMTQAAMAAGRPHIIFPSHEESWFNARQVNRLEVGRTLERSLQRHDLHSRLREILADKMLHACAAALATTIKARQGKQADNLVLASIRRFLA